MPPLTGLVTPTAAAASGRVGRAGHGDHAARFPRHRRPRAAGDALGCSRGRRSAPPGRPRCRLRRIRRRAGGGGGDGPGADVLVTSDLKHHSASEVLADYGIGLIDAAHWATEQPWLAMAADLLVADLRETGTTVETTISTRITDPWTMHAPAVRTQ